MLHSCPKKLRQLLKKEELPPADRCPTLILQFPERSTVCEVLLCILRRMLIDAVILSFFIFLIQLCSLLLFPCYSSHNRLWVSWRQCWRCAWLSTRVSNCLTTTSTQVLIFSIKLLYEHFLKYFLRWILTLQCILWVNLFAIIWITDTIVISFYMSIYIITNVYFLCSGFQQGPEPRGCECGPCATQAAGRSSYQVIHMLFLFCVVNDTRVPFILYCL